MKLSPKTCSTAEFAAFIGRTVRHVQQMVKDDELVKSKMGKLDSTLSLKAYITKLQHALSHGGGENGDIARSRARYESARADEKELHVAIQMSEVVKASDVEKIWVNAASNWRSKLLSLPSKIAIQTSALTDKHEIEDLVMTLVEETLTEISIYADPRKNPQRRNPAKSVKKSTRTTKASPKADR